MLHLAIEQRATESATERTRRRFRGRTSPGEDSGRPVVAGCGEGLAAKPQVTTEKPAAERPVTTRRDGRASPARRERDPRRSVCSAEEGHRDEEVCGEEKGPGEDGREGND
mmetsp:Transcript_49777/g.105848  ORF Transcript_49777/g.105848 Transcript_49777/m.105848 type:complete len:111 (+) Transcript_49777:361-693(+)